MTRITTKADLERWVRENHPDAAADIVAGRLWLRADFPHPVNGLADLDGYLEGIDVCIYCDSPTKAIDAGEQYVPDVRDDAAWEEIAPEHELNCEWVITRAHRV